MMPEKPRPQDTGDSAAPAAGKQDEKKKSPKLPLGERLLQSGLISRDQLETALREQSTRTDKRKMIGEVLVEMGFITESTLAEILTENSSRKFNIKNAVLDPKLIKQIPKDVAQRYRAVPISIEDGAIILAINDVYNIIAIDQIGGYFPSSLKITPVYASETDIIEILDQYHGYETSIGGILREIETGLREAKGALSGEQEGYVNPTVRLVDAILIDSIKRGASDIHFEPEGSFLRLRYRIDGKLQQIRSFHKDYWPAVAVRIKIMSHMNIAENRKPQDGRTSYTVMGREIDFRVATHPTVHGENIVMRVLDKQKALMPVSSLGLSKNNEKLLLKLLKRPEGIIIVTGPTGSGKTTTLYSVLSYINSVDVNIMTLENPVEYQLPMLRQTNISEDKGMDFADGVKSLMRQDPDIIFVGEVRDEATATMAMRAAMTGHKVFTTLHTNDAVGAIPRLVDIGIPPYLLGGALVCVVAQRLIRKLCSKCKKPYRATEEDMRMLGVKEPCSLYKAVGCDACFGQGYKGRMAVHEILPVSKEMDELISAEASRAKVLEAAGRAGYVPMWRDGIKKVAAGHSTLEELIRVVDMTDRM